MVRLLMNVLTNIKIDMTIKSVLKRIYFWLLLPFKQSLYNHPLYKTESSLKVFWYQCKFIMKYSEPDAFYYLYDFPNKTVGERLEYIPYPLFRNERNKLNSRMNSYTGTEAVGFNYLSLLRDKFYFGQFLRSVGFNTPENYILIDGPSSTYFDLRSNSRKPLEKINEEVIDAFCKICIGECGKDIFRLRCQNGVIYVNDNPTTFYQFRKNVENGVFLVQSKVRNHPIINRLYGKSVNTLRVITCRDRYGKCQVLSAVLRVGAHGNTVDNWAAGGLVVGIDDNGKLKSTASYEFSIDGKLRENSHPDSAVRFDEITVPYYKTAIQASRELHELFYGISTIGWDVAITESGPCFIEGNDNYEISLNQVADCGLWQRWKELYN